MIWKKKNSIGQGSNQLSHPIEHEINLEPHNISFGTDNVIPFAREHATNNTWRLQLQDSLKRNLMWRKVSLIIGDPLGRMQNKSTSHYRDLTTAKAGPKA